jgi:uncharacterized protein (UPF0548 family)
MSHPAYERGMTRHPLSHVPAGLRGAETSISVPPAARDAVAALVSSWEFKRRAGFETPADAPTPDAEGVLATRLLGIRFAEPVRVVWADGSGFGYETRPGHPLYGEESFVLDDRGVFTARSVSRPAGWFWRLGTPALRTLQRSVFRRYIRIVRAEIAAVR